MKKATNSILVFSVIFAMLLSLGACSSTPKPTAAPSTEAATAAAAAATAVATASAIAAGEGDVWALQGWEKGTWPWPAPWGDQPKLTVDYVYRQTPANVQRKMEGNFYPEGWPIVKDKVTLKCFTIASPAVENLDTNFIITNLEKKTNVHIEWIVANPETVAEKRNITLSSGDLPDFFISSAFSKNDDLNFGAKQNLIIPLNTLIDKYGYYTKTMFDHWNLAKKDVIAPDGNIYSLPSVWDAYYDLYDNKGWINKAWLDKLDLQVPTTVEEYYNVLKAFKTRDPNGNGKPDEMPLVGCREGTGWYTKITGFFMNPFTYSPNSHIVVENGKVAFAPTKTEYKEGLKWLNKLVSEGLLDEQSFLRDDQQLVAIGQNPGAEIAGSFCGGYYGVLTGDTYGDRSPDYVAMPPLQGPSGNAYNDYLPIQYAYGAAEITSSCKNPEVAFRWLDWWYSVEGIMSYNYGRLGTEWDYADTGAPGIWPGQPTIKVLKFIDPAQPNNIGLNTIGFPVAWLEWNLTEVPGADYNAKMNKWTKDLYAGHEVKERFPENPFYPLEYTEEVAQLATSINNYIKETDAKFVIGKMDIEKDWDSYVSTLDKLGMKRYLELQQIGYDLYLKAQNSK